MGQKLVWLTILRIYEILIIILIRKLVIVITSNLAIRFSSAFKMVVLAFLRRAAEYLHLTFWMINVVNSAVKLLAVVGRHYFACVGVWLEASAVAAGAHWFEDVVLA